MISQLSRLSQKHKIKHFLRELQLLLTTQWLFGIWETTKGKNPNPPRLLSSAPDPFSLPPLSFTPRGVGGDGGSEMPVRELAERWGLEARRQFGSDDQWDFGAFLGICLCCSPGVCANDQQLETEICSPLPLPVSFYLPSVALPHNP